MGDDNPLQPALQRFREIQEEATKEVHSVLPDMEELFPIRQALSTNPEPINEAIMALARSRQEGVADARAAQQEGVDALIQQVIASAVPTVFNAFTGGENNTNLAELAMKLPVARAEGAAAVREAERQANQAELSGQLQVAQNNVEAEQFNQEQQQAADAANAQARAKQFVIEQGMINQAQSRILELMQLGRQEEAAELNAQVERVRLATAQLNNKLKQKELEALENGVTSEFTTHADIQGIFDNLRASTQSVEKLSSDGFEIEPNSTVGSKLIEKRDQFEAEYKAALRTMPPEEFAKTFQNVISTAAQTEPAPDIEDGEDAPVVSEQKDVEFAVEAVRREALARGMEPEVVDLAVSATSMEPENLQRSVVSAIRTGDKRKAEIIVPIAMTRGVVSEAQIKDLLKFMQEREQRRQTSPEQGF